MHKAINMLVAATMDPTDKSNSPEINSNVANRAIIPIETDMSRMDLIIKIELNPFS